jgi:hypothetical protein
MITITVMLTPLLLPLLFLAFLDAKSYVLLSFNAFLDHCGFFFFFFVLNVFICFLLAFCNLTKRVTILVCFIYFSFNVQLLDGFPSILLLYAVSVCHGDMDDFSAARMILSGIPLDESFLQHWLSILMKEKQRSLGGEKLPVPESYYSLGTADPTGILESDEVCVILYVYCLTCLSFLCG